MNFVHVCVVGVGGVGGGGEASIIFKTETPRIETLHTFDSKVIL